MTEHGKEMTLYPDSMSLSGAGGKISLMDDIGLDITSERGITIIGRSVEFNAPKVSIIAESSELMLAKGDPLQGIVDASFVVSSQYDLLSKGFTHIEGWNCIKHEPYIDQPEEGHFDWGGLACNVLAGLVVVGAVALTLFTIGAAAPVIIGAIAVGSMAVVSQGISDYMSGNVSDTASYVRAGFLGAVAGAVSGGVSALIEGAIPAGATLLVKMGITGASGVVETLIENTIMGQKTTWQELCFAFGMSAAMFGIGDEVGRAFKKARSGASQTDNVARAVTGQADDVLENAAKQADNVVDDAAKQTGDVLNEDGNYSSFRDLMTPEEAAKYDEYWDKVTQRQIVEDVDSGKIAFTNARKDNMPKGNYGEMKTDVIFEGAGNTRMGDPSTRVTSLNAKTHQGLDGVYKCGNPPPEYFIVESKFGSSQLSMLSDGKTRQMSEPWILGDNRLKNAVGSDTANQILDALENDPSNVISVLSQVKSDGSVKFFKLDVDGKKIGEFIP